MTGLWSTLFGSENVIKKAADGIYHGVDKALYTDEEKAGGFLKLLSAYEPFKIAQRLLALTLAIPFVMVWILSAGMLVASGFVDPAYGKQIAESARVLSEMNQSTLGTPVALVVGFYFAGGALEGVAARIKGSK